jgi:hypothetical protein
MPQMVTFSEMRDYISKHSFESRAILESRQLDNSNFSENQKNVFLSHSSLDRDLLPYVVKILKNHGGNPYIDIGDNRLPNPPSVNTAITLKDTIKQCKRFVLFVTTNSKDSKWIPWELGIGDGSKTNNDIAIFPSAEEENNMDWLSQEYLGLYKRIVWGNIEGIEKEVWMVWNHQKNQAIELSKWLNS